MPVWRNHVGCHDKTWFPYPIDGSDVFGDHLWALDREQLIGTVERGTGRNGAIRRCHRRLLEHSAHCCHPLSHTPANPHFGTPCGKAEGVVHGGVGDGDPCRDQRAGMSGDADGPSEQVRG